MDDWDTGSSVVEMPKLVSSSGQRFNRGRGFSVPREDPVVGCGGDKGGFGNSMNGGSFNGGSKGNDGWGSVDNGSKGDDGWGNSAVESSKADDGWGDGGGGSGSGGFGGSSYNDDHGDGDRDRGQRGRGRGGGRGRGRGRGGGGGFSDREDRDKNNDDVGEDGEPQKPREIYIPPEPSNDENVLFGSGISSGLNFEKYDNITIKVTGENVPPPIESFEQAGLRQFVLDNVKKSSYTKPTPVQKHALPIVMAARDVMACAQTGSGKTAAFLLPIVNMLLADPRELVLTSSHCEPHAVIVSPTRELTLQIFNEARKFSHGSTVRAAVAYGGTASYYQAQQVMRGCHILVATPGRLLDFVERGRIKFSSVRFVVLDEADRMLDMGFMPAMEKMMNHESMVPVGERQTLMFSATFPEEVQRLAHQFLSNYIFLAVGIVGGACADVEQRFHQVSKFEKRPKLTELLKQEGGDRTLVFVEQKRTADFIAAYLSEHDFPTTSIHGDRLQREREEALADFKSGRMGVLVATAVAARGLDIKNVSHVVNFDLPKSIDEYVHRIGRTGRVGNRGLATSFYDSENDSPLARDLVRILQQADQEVPSWLETDAAGGGFSSAPARGGRFGGRDFRKFDSDGGQEKFDDFGGAQPSNQEEDEVW